jgi:antitoxin VapB
MSINIKNERVSKLAVALAEQTGESITDAVGKAIEERLERLTKKKSREGLADRLRAISDVVVRHASPEWLAKTQQEFDDELYDEMGLPR